MAIKQLLITFTLLLVSSTLFASPQIQHWSSSNGAQVYFVPANELPMVDIQITFDGGAARETKGGLAAMTSALMDEGTGNMDANQIAEATEGVGAIIEFSSHHDMAIASLRSVTDAALFNPAVELFDKLLSQPSFPEASLQRIRNNMLIGVQAKKQQPGALANDAFMAALYDGHPYGQPASGTEESLNSINREDILAHYKRYYVANNAVIAIVGDLDRNEAEQLVERVIGQLPAGEKAAALPRVEPLHTPFEQRIPHPSSQSHVMVGQPGSKRGDKDYFALYVGNHILGGSGLTSRISNEIREQRGLAYSAYSYFSPMREYGPFIMGLQTKNASVEEALQVLRDTLLSFRETGPTAEELEAAQKNITGGFPLKLDSNKKIVQYLGMIGFYGLPLDYLDNFNANVNAVTIEAIRDAFQRRIDPDKLVTVVVGGEN